MKTKRKNFYCEEKAFYYLNQQIIPGRSKDTILWSSCRDTTKAVKHLEITSQSRLRRVLFPKSE